MTDMRTWRNELEFDVAGYRLDNGLRVLLHHDDSIPIVAVNLWYHVGSKDERPDRTGLAHLFEHLMFEGSANHDAEYFGPLQEAGGSVNGSTSVDRTRYYDVVPSNFLELALWLEADRMVNLLPALSLAKLDNQRSVVKNERRQRVDNQPYGRVSEAMALALFPPDHPYSWPVIGSMEHLEATALDDVRGFFREFYQPANATLALSGCFDDGPARAWIERYFGVAPTGPPIHRGHAETPALAEPKRLEWTEPVALPRLDLVWFGCPRFANDEPALDFAARILGGRSKDSRLKRRLVRDRKLVNTVGAYHDSLRLAGRFGVRAYALPDADLDVVEQSILEEVDLLRREPPSDAEMQRARHAFENLALARIETALGKADAFNHSLFYAGEVTPTSFVEDLESYRRLNAEDVRRAAERYLTEGRLTVAVKPASKGTSIVRPSSDDGAVKPLVRNPSSTFGERMPGAGPEPEFGLPPIRRAVSAAGLSIALVEWPKLPRVDFVLLFDAGSRHDPIDKLGLARLVSEMLDEGTTTHDGLALARRLDLLGASLSTSIGVESATISLRTLRETLPEAFSLLADVALDPRFDGADLQRERGRLLAELAYRRKEPTGQADDALDAAIFGPLHPYGRPPDGTSAGVEAVEAADLIDFHRARYDLATATLLVVGDTNLDEVRELADAHFGVAVAGSNVVGRPSPIDGDGANEFAALLEPGPTLQVIERPEAAQSIIRVGRASVDRRTPDYFDLLVLNTLLGGQFASRLNRNLRGEKGLTYGVRSAFRLRRQGGSFVAGADVQSNATAEAVAAVLREIAGPAGADPVADAELQFAIRYLSRRFPSRFETAGGIMANLVQSAVYDLPDDFYDRYLLNVHQVTTRSIRSAAERHLTLDGMKVAVVAAPDHAAGLHDAVAEILNIS